MWCRLIKREKSLSSHAVFTWNYGVQGVIMALKLFYGYGAVFDTNNMVCLERLAWHLNLCQKMWISIITDWIIFFIWKKTTCDLQSTRIGRLEKSTLFSSRNWGNVVKTCLMYYTQIVFLVRPTWRSLNYRIKAEKLRLFNLTNNCY